MDRGRANTAARTTDVATQTQLRALPATSAESRSRLHWFIGTSDLAAQDPGSLTYEPHFGLREKPFSLASDPRFFYSQSSHGVSFDTLAAGIRRREGILALMGEVGTGKTTLCRAVLQALDRRTFAAFVPDPFLSREDLLKTLLVDFGVVSVDEIRNGRLRGASRTDLSYPLYDFLASLQPLKAFAVVMIDEAHNLTTELLEEIRILSDLEKNREKLLEVMLIGQPELQERLASTEMRQLAQRVSLRCELVPLAPEEVKAYVSHRLTVAGNDGRVRFTEQAAECVATASSGIPRVVNLICDRALLKAALSGTSIINAEHVVWAATDLQLPASRVGPLPTSRPATLVLPPPPNAVAAPTSEVSSAPARDAPSRAVDLIRPAEHNAEVSAPRTVPAQQPVADDVSDGRPRKRWLMVTAACIVLASGAGIWATRESLARLFGQQQAVVVPAPVGEKPSPSLTSAPAEAQSVTPPAAAEPVQGATQVALQMATFQTAARVQQAIEELRSAGYRPYSVELAPQDGERMLAVLLGPYSDQAAAEHDLDAVRRLPGYGSARVVQAVPALLPPASKP
jgi:type II secretory pathway predicted ATPase ExeA